MARRDCTQPRTHIYAQHAAFPFTRVTHCRRRLRTAHTVHAKAPVQRVVFAPERAGTQTPSRTSPVPTQPTPSTAPSANDRPCDHRLAAVSCAQGRKQAPTAQRTRGPAACAGEAPTRATRGKGGCVHATCPVRGPRAPPARVRESRAWRPGRWAGQVRPREVAAACGPTFLKTIRRSSSSVICSSYQKPLHRVCEESAMPPPRRLSRLHV